ncbi:MAG: 23S rRNA (pseudouridine(1915)-N(3))-methyltransferase RlmH [Burkholderiales bacterium]
MKLLVVAVGHKAPAWIDAGFAEYAGRMPREARIKMIGIKPEARGENERAAGVKRVTEAEAKRIAAALPSDCVKVVLDERGVGCTTEDVARRLGAWQIEGRDVAFVIGGADGVSETLKREADFLWSLSGLTLPHALVRVIVAEQLYRAVSILKGHPYHRGSKA